MDFSEATIKRFLEKVERRAPGDCWPWKGLIGPRGYGVFRTYQGGKYKNHAAHRFALVIETGINPSILMCLHACDNKPCCNPSHLNWGTAKENCIEAFQRIPGRRELQRAIILKLVKSGKPARALAKLSPSQICEVKSCLKKGVSQVAIAAAFGVCQQTISRISTGRTKLYR